MERLVPSLKVREGFMKEVVFKVDLKEWVELRFKFHSLKNR